MTRTYDSPLRRKQMEQTRGRLVAKLLELLADDTIADVSVADVARRAGVSVRTAYRHFPTKEELLEAAAATSSFGRSSALQPPRDAADLPRFVGSLVAAYAENETTIRAQRWSKPAAEVRARRKAHQARLATQVLGPLTAGHEPERARELRAAVLSSFSSTNWLELRTHGGLSAEQAGRATLWVVETLLARLVKESKETKKK